jgi:hypothetical protein
MGKDPHKCRIIERKRRAIILKDEAIPDLNGIGKSEIDGGDG